jgi:large subunit ribosomal protein L24
MLTIRKNDTVKVLAGKDKGKVGKVLRVYPDRNRAIVQGVNFVKKHMKQRKQDQQAGMVQQEATINMANLMLLCKRCNRTTRIGVDVLGDGSKVRHCKRCNEVL